MSLKYLTRVFSVHYIPSLFSTLRADGSSSPLHDNRERLGHDDRASMIRHMCKQFFYEKFVRLQLHIIARSLMLPYLANYAIMHVKALLLCGYTKFMSCFPVCVKDRLVFQWISWRHIAIMLVSCAYHHYSPPTEKQSTKAMLQWKLLSDIPCFAMIGLPLGQYMELVYRSSYW